METHIETQWPIGIDALCRARIAFTGGTALADQVLARVEETLFAFQDHEISRETAYAAICWHILKALTGDQGTIGQGLRGG